jgi:putative tryptophan/tyrosine transport system substrate-binding protein
LPRRPGTPIRGLGPSFALFLSPLFGARALVRRATVSKSAISFFVGLLILLHATCSWATVVVIVRTSDAEPYTLAEKSLRDQLAAGHYELHSVLIRDLSQQGIDAAIGKADAVVAIGTTAARWLHKELPTPIKLVYCMVSNARDAGLAEGRDACGVTTDVSIGQQFKLIAEALPHARSVGMLYHSDTAEGKNALQAFTGGVPKGWHVEAVAVNEYSSIADAIQALMKKNVDLIWTTADQKLYDTAAVRALLLAALRAKIPVWGFSPAFVRAGALLGVGVEPRSQGVQVADLLVKVLTDPQKSARSVETANEFQIAVNLIVAEQLGIDIPDSLSQRAKYVYRPEK